MDPIRTDVDAPFGRIADLIALNARQSPDRLALADAQDSIGYAALDALMDRVAAGLQRDGVVHGDAIAICAASSVAYAAVFLGALRAGVAVAPLAPGSTPASLARMMRDADARLLFTDAAAAEVIGAPGEDAITRIALDASAAGQALADWLPPPGTRPFPVDVQPASAFNIIYSSGTTGEPKGIVQGHGMRWAHVQRGARYGYGPDTVTLLSTPLYSNTTLVVFFPTLAFGGCVVLMPKFDAAGYLQIAQARGVTHTMLVPVQYQRLMAHPAFDAHDLSRFQYKFSTSAPFNAALKADVLQRWPGGLIEFYGMTEGGGTVILEAHLHPTKLHTVGQPAPGSDIRLIDEEGREVPPGEAGEVVGHSSGMMTGYHRQPAKTREAEWFAPDGKRFIRTGDIGRFDDEGFLTLFDRKKDMIISGGFNIYPSDLETVLRAHPGVADVAVVGAPSVQWGETPEGYVVRRDGHAVDAAELLAWANAQLGKTQRLARLHFIDELPRSAIGKVLKRELRELNPS
ncbi:class I adenylate-forming enzyme family protein [Variovorax ginsengisoli]|uniref:Acyl-CoA synthetase (AMP-forming)/AMP-acid ligase II n=1 Tax=Variovorax ginsengisoli TaxID=363844 RepID=A0ABT9SAE1_9BURK|nr:class I adenylate-forming enzyme family protein [Variovorax ginsengisoli]MDP9901331.1 acyl-CoA synthetase (AMP-forming)/AMP-acid ligase II [Variovorax ginsengisoli]